MDEVSFLILKIVISISVALITVFLIPYLKEKISTETQKRISEVVSVAVQAAEQTIQGGAAKKEAVMDYVTHWAAVQNIRITRAQIEQILESSVFAIRLAQKQAGQ